MAHPLLEEEEEEGQVSVASGPIQANLWVSHQFLL